MLAMSLFSALFASVWSSECEKTLRLEPCRSFRHIEMKAKPTKIGHFMIARICYNKYSYTNSELLFGAADD